MNSTMSPLVTTEVLPGGCMYPWLEITALLHMKKGHRQLHRPLFQLLVRPR